MPFHELSEVDVVAVSIVEKGANQKRFYLRKSDTIDKPVLTLPGAHTLLKSSDWSAVYCVVAEPGARENPGLGAAEPNIEDVWKSEDDIRKAAHKFMKNGALVNKMHETLEPYGQVVENFIAQADFSVEGETIKKGSWVIGIEPSEEGKLAIEEGRFTGVSIQGTGLRELAKAKGSEGPKAKKCPKCGGTVAADLSKCQNCGHSFAVSKAETDDAAMVRHEAMSDDDNAPVTMGWLRKALGLGASKNDIPEEKNKDMSTTTPIDDRVEAIEKGQSALTEAVTGLVGTVNGLIERLDKKPEEQVTPPTVEEVQKALDDTTTDVIAKLEELGAKVDALGEGSSTQQATHTKVTKTDDHPLAGILD